jgi:hypothetical protein
MAIYRVWDGGSNTAPYETWAKAATTFATGVGATAAGDTVWVAKDHSESGTVTATGAGTMTAPIHIYSVDRTDDSYAIGTLYQISGTGAADFNLIGEAHVRGLTFDVPDNYTVDAGLWEDCTFRIGSASAQWNLAGDNVGGTHFRNCTFTCIDSGDNTLFQNIGECVFEGCDFTGAYFATASFNASNSRVTSLKFIGCDMNAGAYGDTIINGGSFGETTNLIDFIQCKMPSGVDVTTDGDMDACYADEINLWNCDSGTGYYRTETYQKRGTVKTGTTNTRLWLDVDNGGSAVSHIMTAGTTYVPTQVEPLRGIPLTAYAEAAGTPTTATFTVECLQHNASLTITDTEIWLEARFMGTSGVPKWVSESTRVIDPSEATGTTVTSSSDANWNVTTGKSKFKLSLTTTANIEQDGMWEIRVMLGGNHDVTYDPLVTVS